MQFLTNLNLNKNELQNFVVQNLAAAPSTSKKGQLYYNTNDNLLYQFDGLKWHPVGAPLEAATTDKLGGIKLGPEFELDSTEHLIVVNIEWGKITGTPKTLAEYGITDVKIEGNKITIGKESIDKIVSDANYVHTDNNYTTNDKNKLNGIEPNAQVNKIEQIKLNNTTIPISKDDTKTVKIEAVPIDGTVAMTGNLQMGSHKITGLAEGSAINDAATYGQLISKIQGLGTVFNIVGSVKNITELYATGKKKTGNVYYVKEDETINPENPNKIPAGFYPGKVGYIWLADNKEVSEEPGHWEQLGQTIDVSKYLAKSELAKTTGSSEQTAMTQKATTNALDLKADKKTVSTIPIVSIKTDTIPNKNSTTEVSIPLNGKEVIGTFVKDANGEMIITNVKITSSAVIFTINAAYTNTLTCSVICV